MPLDFFHPPLLRTCTISFSTPSPIRPTRFLAAAPPSDLHDFFQPSPHHTCMILFTPIRLVRFLSALPIRLAWFLSAPTPLDLHEYFHPHRTCTISFSSPIRLARFLLPPIRPVCFLSVPIRHVHLATLQFTCKLVANGNELCIQGFFKFKLRMSSSKLIGCWVQYLRLFISC